MDDSDGTQKHQSINWKKIGRWYVLAFPFFLLVSLVFVHLARPDTQYRLRSAWYQWRYPDTNVAYYPQNPQLEKNTYIPPAFELYSIAQTSDQMKLRLTQDQVRRSYQSRYADGYIYFSDGVTLFSYAVENRQTHTIYSTTADEFTIDRVIGEDDTYVYISLRLEDDPVYRTLYIQKVDKKTGEGSQVFTHNGSIYEIVTDFFVHDGVSYILTAGGDGCGGGSRLLRVVGNTTEEIALFGVGCVENPRFVGISADKSRVIAAAILHESKDNDGMNFCRYDVLYTIDVATGEVTPVYDLKQFALCADVVSYDPVTNFAIIVGEGKAHLIDVEKKEQVRSVDMPTVAYAGWKLVGNMLAGYVYNTKTIVTVDLDTAQMHEAVWENAASSRTIPTILGRDRDEIFVVAQ